MSLKPSDLIASASAVLAFIALLIGIYAAIVTQRVATSGFQSAEKVKSDTAVLVAALHGLIVKAAPYSQEDSKLRDDKNFSEYIDIQPEKAIIQSFLNSPTAIAYYSFVIRKSKEATEAGRGEEWRVFFAYLSKLTSETSVLSAGKDAVQIEGMFENISDDDLEEMSSSLENLVGTIKTTLRDRRYDTLVEGFVRWVHDGQSHEDDSQTIQKFLSYLRDQGINDPDVDMLWAARSGNSEILRNALQHGANVNVTPSQIISRYKQMWQTFEAKQHLEIQTGP